MSDNNIIKSLEYCPEQGITSECERCKVKKGCRAELVAKALDLINRQQAEIETLKGWERLLKAESHAPIIEKAKAEAVQDFVNKIRTRLNCNTPRGAYLLNIVDNLVKEMVGEADG